MTQQTNAHFNMLEQQVRPSDVLNPRVLSALEKVKRSEFVDVSLAGLAYADTELPIGYGQSILAPVLIGRMLQAVDVQQNEHVLEIGTGSGYVTALLEQLSAHVTTVEMIAELSGIAQQNLSHLKTISFAIGDASKGWLLADRVDVIVSTAAFASVPDDYLQSLKVGGRMIAAVGEGEPMSVNVIRRVSEREWQTETMFETVIPVMINAEAKAEFKF
ncbi:protein-L-isoaspartate O-methyltransferase [Pseudomonadota bacterium]|nr:protein-L-isoaspartate O-methyltransferase [Pseudomonadota bacterium]